MITVYTTKKVAYVLHKELKAGGEGTVYYILGKPHLVAKIYHHVDSSKSIHREKMVHIQAKLACMMAAPPDDRAARQFKGHQSIAWPQDILFDDGGRFVGYTMPFLNEARELFLLYHPVERKKSFPPSFKLPAFTIAAYNLSSAVGLLHKCGYVIGDLNSTNVLIAVNGLVSIIDCDSFQVVCNGNQFPCGVGKVDYLAPELFGKALSSTVRTVEHDNYALAVLIYQLLMQGNHPFRSTWIGQGPDPGIHGKMREGYYPHCPAHQGNVRAPANPPLRRLPPEIQGLLLQCFVDGYQHPTRRPAAEVWMRALRRMDQELQNKGKGPKPGTQRPVPGPSMPRVSGAASPKAAMGKGISAVPGPTSVPTHRRRVAPPAAPTPTVNAPTGGRVRAAKTGTQPPVQKARVIGQSTAPSSPPAAGGTAARSQPIRPKATGVAPAVSPGSQRGGRTPQVPVQAPATRSLPTGGGHARGVAQAGGVKQRAPLTKAVVFAVLALVGCGCVAIFRGQIGSFVSEVANAIPAFIPFQGPTEEIPPVIAPPPPTEAPMTFETGTSRGTTEGGDDLWLLTLPKDGMVTLRLIYEDACELTESQFHLELQYQRREPYLSHVDDRNPCSQELIVGGGGGGDAILRVFNSVDWKSVDYQIVAEGIDALWR